MSDKWKLFFTWVFSLVTSPYVMSEINMDISIPRIIIVSILMTPIWIICYIMVIISWSRWSDDIERRNRENHMREDRDWKSSTNIDLIEVPDFDKKVRACCFQTARLGDSYCVCGRGVTIELKQHFLPD